MPEAFVSGIDDQSRHKVIDLLNARLADMTALTLAVKQAHWNLKGPGFIGVHELLDDVADRLRDGQDTIAERCTILGGQAKGTVEVAASESSMEPYPTDMEAIEDHIVALKDRFLKVGEMIRKAAETADEAGDPDTEDLFVEISRQIDKDCWFIGANGKQ
ncbi:DNA starvation/stationary phase protection protein Dps [Maribius pontilimi]|uniref:DNA starvation/stationary phase protection protein Dps n=1 Tax=Palleronia pontilimi TaxID=1964209 RepID=A0A934IHT7_9RHOB|nr:DNA starvation/stationary phase protection protein Dps [Palleronia pontilimi]MBJ3763136.1 DNA starvation/stationary phase protection protein Dps [Palleronia pontilimi]